MSDSATSSPRPAAAPRQNQRSTREVLWEEYCALFDKLEDLPSRRSPFPTKQRLGRLQDDLRAQLEQERTRLGVIRAAGPRPENEYVLSDDEIKALLAEVDALEPGEPVGNITKPAAVPWWRRPAAWFRSAREEDADTSPPPPAANVDPAAEIHQEKAQALCLSGGGIRSAAFCMGVLQALARRRMLARIHYLSTVSGGGYIGAWLTTLIQRLAGSVLLAQYMIARIPASNRVRNVREYTNFLTPSPGYVSADARTAALLVVRNILLNWMLFLPALLALSLIPLAFLGAVASGHLIAADRFDIIPTVALLLFAAVPLFAAALFTIRALPSHSRLPDPTPGQVQGWTTPRVLLSISLLVLLWAFLLTVWFTFAAASRPLPLVMIGAVTVDVVTMLAAYVTAWLLEPDAEQRGFFGDNLATWMAGCAVDAIIVATGMWLGVNQRANILAVLAPAWIVVGHIAQTAFYVGMRQYAREPDLDREWLGRLNADTLGITIAWGIFAAIILYSAELIGTIGVQAGLLGAGGTGSLAAAIGFSARTLFLRQTPGEAKGFRIRWDMVMLGATLVFGVLLFTLLGVLAQLLTMLALGVWGWLIEGQSLGYPWSHPWQSLAAEWNELQQFCLPTDESGWDPALPQPWAILLASLLLAVLLTLFALRLGHRVNVNRFSLHDLYRNRLVRAFPGSARSRTERSPDALTGFDTSDNPRMSELFDRRPDQRVLFPVVNVTLNLVATRQNSLAERKAAPFTITPFRCGADFLDRSGLTSAPGTGRGFIRTRDYAGREVEDNYVDRGITLGTAMTISGAALSPNMGYHSSPPAAFLMTLFNVRLGAWLPNPRAARPREARLAKPPNAVLALLSEMLGLTNSDRRSIYLSDGGHFDNLGLYEMLRRQCRYIVVVDAGADPDYAYADLGATLRRAAIDLDVRVEFDRPIAPGNSRPASPVRKATIYYHDGRIGRLAYVKPYIPYGTPADIKAYAAAHASFPHETTANQFFTESQFESYRHLGEYLMTRVLDGFADLPAMCDALQ